ncbi:type I-E CRISPR-associated protein Cas6/Cse3/CasE [Corynebacterium sp. CNCTC7651]|uniref:type I-E CRISPR-associated protein Cas6/Cse3/CasE n=1 Tax=Corynebacterium sp. CNCTC7651 TaxID=2815361 RepID=UPI001F2DBDA5|nr:type I-E CRISPR-associated protein Cas6/Cse3/CasE [Corynebacterium sp. CNCTC7651]UIZ92563.1 type I-E CRISPR-associated protein Cas6/Cse3/CasE [Corynebacterium sp. CNCTC7651]
MTTMTRVLINPKRRGGARLLSDAQSMHAAVRSAFPPDIDETDSRVLWRVDPHEHHSVLYIVGPEVPTVDHIVDQAGWPERPGETANYDRLLGSLMKGQRWHFELVANPTYSVFEKGKRGKVKAHVSPVHQLDWLYKKAPGCGFALAQRDATDALGAVPQITERWTDVFHRDRAAGARKQPVRVAKARFSGTLQVSDAALLRTSLQQGIGRAKGYGCGLLTLAPLGQIQ